MIRSPGAGELLNGLLALFLSILVWRVTHVVWAWALLFAPGSVLVLMGLCKAFRE